ncbi:MAG: hypothetical protein WC838_00825, partial [Candidatus Margulisiibacteriota bacterium]
YSTNDEKTGIGLYKYDRKAKKNYFFIKNRSQVFTMFTNIDREDLKNPLVLHTLTALYEQAKDIEETQSGFEQCLDRIAGN